MTDSVKHRYETIEFEGMDVHVRSLRDLLQFDDKCAAEAEGLGISSAMWPLFGVLWDSSRALARLMIHYEVEGKSVLEVGCGLGLASLVLNERGTNITATDFNPAVGAFLKCNTDLNDQQAIPFICADWAEETSALGHFDLIVGSEVLYEQHQVVMFASFLNAHANPSCEVLLIDPGRHLANRWGREMAPFGFTYSREAAAEGDGVEGPYSGLLLRCVREI